MSDVWDSYDDEDDTDAKPPAKKAPAGLRQHVKKLEEENANYRTRLSELETAHRRNTVDRLIGEKGLPPKLAALIPADVEATAEAVGKWLEDYQDLFAPKAPEPPGGDSGGAELDDYGAEFGRMNRALAGSATPSAGGDLMAELKSKSLTPERLLELVESAGGGYGSGG